MLTPFEDLDFCKVISPDDWMGKSVSPDNYFRRAYGALSIICSEISSSNVKPENILDFGCGHGAVLRMLRAQFPTSKIIGCDVDESWINWCRQNLHVSVLPSDPDIKKAHIEDNQYDVIWMGSVFTHVPIESAHCLLKQIFSGLSSNGIAIFSTAGETVKMRFRPDSERFLDKTQAHQLLDDYKIGGYGFCPYQGGRYPDWGRSIVSRDKMALLIATNGLELVRFKKDAWGGRQDVYTVCKK